MYISVYNTSKNVAMHEPKGAQHLIAGVSILSKARVPVLQVICYASVVMLLYHHV